MAKKLETREIQLPNEIYRLVIHRTLGPGDLHPCHRRNDRQQQGTVVVLIATRTNFAIVQQMETRQSVEYNQDGNDVDNR